MDLIEKLGGYEEAKKIKVAFDATHYCISRKSQMKMFPVGAISDATIAASSACGFKETKLEDNDLVTQEQINKALLEHRRQHNTFEVEDNVVCWVTDRVGLIDCFIGDYFCMVKIKNDVGGFTFIKNNMEAIKHATDAEIEAGKRLDD